MKRIPVYIKYCGGCNPKYDRSKLADRLLQDRPELRLVGSGEALISLIICGCPSACADVSDAVAPYGMLHVWDPSGYEALLLALDRAELQIGICE